jgi:hypothetical protein
MPDRLAHPCQDCGATPGTEHGDGCDTARCLAYGTQRLQCMPGARMVVRGVFHWGGVDVDWEQDGHDCGRDLWTGRWPGVAECEEFDWWAVFVPNGNPSWRPVPAGTPAAVPDLNRLVTEAKWDAQQVRWVIDHG